MIVLTLAALLNAACFIRLPKQRGKTGYKLGAWMRWREYYPTILYIILGNLAYFYVFHEYELWLYSSFLGNIYTGLAITFLIYPPMVALYLEYFPERKVMQAVYILSWTAIGTLIEYFACLSGGIIYDHGWNLLWSTIIFIGSFILLRVHYRHPLIVWPISLLCAVAVALIFGLPFPQ